MLAALRLIRDRCEQPIGPRPQSDMLADPDRLLARRAHLDEMLALAFAKRDFQAPCRPETVDALDDPIEQVAPGLGDDGDLVWTDEEARPAIRQSVRIDIEITPREVDAAGGDSDRNAQ